MNPNIEHLDMWFDQIKAVAVEKAYDTEVPMQLFLLQPDGTMEGGGMEGNPQIMLYNILKTHQPEGFVMVCEARYKKCDCDDKHGPDAGCTTDIQRGDISDNVNNPEALIVFGMVRGGQPRIEMADITGEIPDRDIDEWKEDGSFTGALAEIAMEVMK
jgi:hypothetical protein